MHRTQIKVAFFAIVCFVTVAFLEGLVRVVHTVRPVYEDKTTLYDDHERFHHWHKPDRAMRYRAVTGEFDVAVRTNEHGMAGPSVPMEHPPGVSRIAVLGDSFVEGFYTEESQSFVSLIETKLRSATSSPIEVLNFGVSSFSPVPAYFLLTELVSSFEPDEVVFVFHFTDVTNDWDYIQTAVRDSTGRVVGVDGRISKGPVYRVLEKSAAMRFLVQRFRAITRVRRAQTEVAARNLKHNFTAIFKDPYEAEDEEAWSVTLEHLGLMKAWCDQRGIPFVLAVMPAMQQVEAGSAADATRFPGLIPEGGGLLQSRSMQRRLEGWAAEHGAGFLDLLPPAAEWETSHDGKLFYPLDQHLSPDGTELVADAISEYLITHTPALSGDPERSSGP